MTAFDKTPINFEKIEKSSASFALMKKIPAFWLGMFSACDFKMNQSVDPRNCRKWESAKAISVVGFAQTMKSDMDLLTLEGFLGRRYEVDLLKVGNPSLPSDQLDSLQYSIVETIIDRPRQKIELVNLAKVAKISLLLGNDPAKELQRFSRQADEPKGLYAFVGILDSVAREVTANMCLSLQGKTVAFTPQAMEELSQR